MSEKTAIGWTDHTFNPWWGCARVSQGCVHCYAETFAKRTGHDVWGPGGRRFFGKNHWAEPITWDRKAQDAGVRRRVFCGSMCDVFEDRRDLDGYRAALWFLIDMTPHLDWLLLTKRPENIARLMPEAPPLQHAWHNVWLGTSVEDDAAADARIHHLTACRDMADVLFLSCEPLIGMLRVGLDVDERVDWVIAGGESGPGFRPMDPRWLVALANRCTSAGVPLFVKQDSGLKPGQQGRIPDALWARKEFPR